MTYDPARTGAVQGPERWRTALAEWAIPDEIELDPSRSPWGHDVAGFRDRALRARGRRNPADELALAALDGGGTVLDVGCGAGAASVPLVPSATSVTGADPSAGMLAAFAEVMASLGVIHHEVEGRWPDVATSVAAHDVVVCHDVLFDVPELAPFVAALTDRARRRVVVVVPERHPMTWTTPYWRALHGVDRPVRPTAEDAIGVIAEVVGHLPTVERYREPTRWAHATQEEAIATVSQRLGLPADRDDDVRLVLEHTPPPAERVAVALAWAGGAPAEA